MSTHNTGGSRRRRIAGERRPSRPAEEPTPSSPTTSPAGPAESTGSVPASAAPPAQPPVVEPPRPEEPVATAPAARDDAGRSGGWWGSTASLAVLGSAAAILVTLGVLAALGLLGNAGIADLREADAAQRAADTAPASAERAAEAILAYDHQTLEADQDAATRVMTEDFAAQYSDTFEKVVRPTAEETRATVVATVKGSSVVRASSDRVRVLLFVDQTTVSRANENPQTALNRVEMIMVREGDSWLVDAITSY